MTEQTNMASDTEHGSTPCGSYYCTYILFCARCKLATRCSDTSAVGDSANGCLYCAFTDPDSGKGQWLVVPMERDTFQCGDNCNCVRCNRPESRE